MTTTIWREYIPDCLVPIDVTQTWDSSTDTWDENNDTWDGNHSGGYQVIWTVKLGD